MPERKEAEKKVRSFAKDLQSNIQEMNTEYQNKLQQYKQKQASMTQTEKQNQQDQLNNLQQRIQKAQQRAQQDLRKQEQELMQPLIAKVDSAIEKVAEREGYTYVFDISAGNVPYAGGTDLTPKVKEELGIKGKEPVDPSNTRLNPAGGQGGRQGRGGRGRGGGR